MDRWLRADVIQETAARLYPRWETLDHSVPLWNLAATIAVRVVHNHRRKESRIELVSDFAPAHEDDVALRGLQRAQLDKARTALQQLSTDQRSVLLAEVGEALVPAGTRNRINVLRLRARARLRETLGPWAPSAVALRLRLLRTRISQRSSSLEVYASAIASGLVNLAIVVTIGLAAAPVEAENAATDAANFVQPERGRLSSPAELRDNDHDHMAILQRPDRHRLSRAKVRVQEEAGGVPYVVANSRANARRLTGVARERTEYVKGRAEHQAEQKRKLAEKRAAHAQGRAEYQSEHTKAWVEDKLP